MQPCPTCGHGNPEGFRFCGACGSEIVASGAREVRKTVTVVFADVTGSTTLGDRLDPESMRRVMSQYFDEMRAVVEGHGGTVEKFIGDAVMAVFGIPQLHEDDALRAVRAASEMHRRLTSLNQRLQEDFGVGLTARIGVNTGQVVTGDARSGHVYATGDAVNIAARLEQTAQPGEILLGLETWRLTRHAIESEPVGPLELKGKADAVPAYRLRKVRSDAQGLERRLDAPLVGRDGELAVLRTTLGETISGRACMLVTLLGPPGIGKSRIAREISEEARDDAVVVAGQCLPYGEGVTYWPLHEIFRGLGAERELDSALSEGTPEGIAWAVRKSLERRARERPLVLIFEDVHWAEPTLLDLIEHLADWTRDAPLLLVCLARLELLDDRPGWGASRSNARALSIAPLSGEQSDHLIQGLLHGSPLDPATRTRINDVAEGNPLFVEQLLAMLAEEASPDRVPPTIQALLSARLDALPDDERELVERASVIGLEFDWDALSALSPDGRRAPGVQLAALVRKEMIRPHEALEDTFRFRHILIRDAAYERIPKELRADLHERVARSLREATGTLEEIVGYHLEQAYLHLTELGRPTDRARSLAAQAADQLLVAARRAEDRGDVRAAANLLGRGAALLPLNDAVRVALLPSLGTALRECGQMDAAEAVLAEAVERGRAHGDSRVTAAAGIALADLRLHRYPSKYVGQDEARRAVVEAIASFEQLGDRAGLARAFTHRGKLQFWAGEATAALEDLERAALYAREAGDAVQEAESTRYVLAALFRGPVPAAVALSRLGEMRARAVANRRLQITFLAVEAMLTAMLGKFDVARRLIGEARASEDSSVLVIGSAGGQAGGEVELLAGDLEAAERELRPACEELERIGELGYLSSLTPLLIDAVLRQGRVAEAVTLSERWRPERLTVPEDADAHVGWRRVRAKLLAHTGELEGGERLAREAIDLAAKTDFLVLQARAFADLGEVLRLAGRHREAVGATSEAIRRNERKGNAVEADRLRTHMAELGTG